MIDLTVIKKELTNLESKINESFKELEDRVIKLEGGEVVKPVEPVEPEPVEPVIVNKPTFCSKKVDVVWSPHIKRELSSPSSYFYLSSVSNIGHNLSNFNVYPNRSKLYGIPIPPGTSSLMLTTIDASNNTGIAKNVYLTDGSVRYFSGIPNVQLYKGDVNNPYNKCDQLYAVVEIKTTDRSYTVKTIRVQGQIGNTQEARNAYNNWINGKEAGLDGCSKNTNIKFTGCK